MRLFLLERQDDFPADWDENEGFVIAASTRSEARKMAARVCEGRSIESPKTWLNIERSKLTELGEAHARVKPGIVLTAFHAG